MTSNGGEIRFTSRLGAIWFLIVLGSLASLRLLWTGAWAYRAQLFNEQTWWMVVGPPALGAIILLGLLRLGLRGGGQEILISPRRFTYRQRGREYSDRWDRILLSRPNLRTRPTASKAQVTNGNWSIALHGIYFAEFDRLLTEIERRREAARERESGTLT